MTNTIASDLGEAHPDPAADTELTSANSAAAAHQRRTV